jgi:hypothetical protein
VHLPFTSSGSFNFFPFQLIHADVWTSPVLSNYGSQYYPVILDDYSHYVWTFSMRHKNEVLSILLSFHSYVATQHKLPILALQTDNGKEFDNSTLRSFFSAYDIHLRLSCPYTSPQNGKTERILQTLNNSVRTMLMQSRARAEALNTATYLLNWHACRAIGTSTPHELLPGVAPTYDYLRVFGSLCFPNLMAQSVNKLSPRCAPCAFLGYPPNHKGYMCFDVALCKAFTSRHVVFDETQFPFIIILIAATPSSSVTPSSSTANPPPFDADTGPLLHHRPDRTSTSQL